MPFLKRALAQHEEPEAKFIVNCTSDALIDFLRTL